MKIRFFASQKFLEKPNQRSEQVLALTLMEMVINGVSTRKVRAVVEESFGKTGLQNFLDN